MRQLCAFATSKPTTVEVHPQHVWRLLLLLEPEHRYGRWSLQPRLATWQPR